MTRSELAHPKPEEHVLRFACLHTAITTVQTQALLLVDQDQAAEVLACLVRLGLLCPQRYGTPGPVLFRVTPAGLTQVDRGLPGPSASVKHDVGVGWLWLAARKGHLGSRGRVITGRELQVADGDTPTGHLAPSSELAPSRTGLTRRPLGFRVELPDGLALHYPDLILVDERGWTVVELLLTAWPLSLRGTLLSAYAADERVQRVVLAVSEPGIARAILLSPFAPGLRASIEIHPVRLTGDLVLSAGD